VTPSVSGNNQPGGSDWHQPFLQINSRTEVPETDRSCPLLSGDPCPRCAPRGESHAWPALAGHDPGMATLQYESRENMGRKFWTAHYAIRIDPSSPASAHGSSPWRAPQPACPCEGIASDGEGPPALRPEMASGGQGFPPWTRALRAFIVTDHDRIDGAGLGPRRTEPRRSESAGSRKAQNPPRCTTRDRTGQRYTNLTYAAIV
jgi:hypothetical protein